MAEFKLDHVNLNELNSTSFENCQSVVFNQTVQAADKMAVPQAPLFVVDDDEMLAQYTALKLMRELGVRAIPYTRMDAALAAFLRRPEACSGLVTDVFMEPCVEQGCLSGLDLAREFISLGKPVLFLTGLNGVREKAMFTRLGCYIHKEHFSAILTATANGDKTMLRHFLDAAAAPGPQAAPG